MSLPTYSPQVEYDHCLQREREERAAARAASDIAIIGVHTAMAERYADRAWSLSEQHDLPYVPSGLWRGVAIQEQAHG